MGRHGDGFRMVPESALHAFPKPPAVLPCVKGTHQEDFFRASRCGRAFAVFGKSSIQFGRSRL